MVEVVTGLFSGRGVVEMCLFLIFVWVLLGLRRGPGNSNGGLKACVMRFVLWLMK
jgi:hypothetical protein